jgi:hypothetical protein
MEEDFYLNEENANLTNTIYYLAGEYSNLGEYDKALETYEKVLGIEI